MGLALQLRLYPALWLAALLISATHVARFRDDSPPPGEPETTPIEFEGLVLPGPAPGLDRLTFYASPTGAGPECRRVRISVYSTVFDLRRYWNPPLRPGDRIIFRSPARLPAYHQIPGVRDARRYRLTSGCPYEFRLKSPLQLRREGTAWWGRLLAPLFRYTEGFAGTLDSRLQGRARDLAGALFLGRKNDLDSDSRRRARELGVWHLYVVSGFHVSLIGGFAYLALRRIPMLSAPGAAIIAWIYALLAGLSLSALRAVIALSYYLFLTRLRVRVSSVNSLGTVVVLLWLWEPAGLTSPGFHFTLACLTALAVAAGPTDKWRRMTHGVFIPGGRLSVENRPHEVLTRALRFRLEHFTCGEITRLGRSWGRLLAFLLGWMGTTLVISCAAVAFVLPLTLYYGNLLTTTAAMSNLILLPLCSMLIGLLGLLFLTYWAPPAATILFPLADALSSAFEAAAGHVWSLSSYAYGPHIHWSQLLLYWGGLLLALMARRRAALVWIPLLGLVLLRFPAEPSGDYFQLTMLDVGQGEAIHLRYPDGSHSLIDSGGRPGALDPLFVGQNLVGRYLWHEGIGALEAAFLTHSDADHSQGFRFVRRAFPIQLFFVSAAESAASPRAVALQAGGIWSRASVSHRVVSPESAAGSGNRNDDSLVIRVDYRAFSALLTGDISSRVERRLEIEPVTLLKVAHHGSRSSSSSSFLELSRPRLALISAGRHNLFGHPSLEVMGRLDRAGVPVFTTAECGSLRITTDGISWQLQRYNSWRGRWEPPPRTCSRSASDS